MYLKRVELLGFKTFAERTDLLFGPGITAVVGPNGSGKSNIADAIIWALGETSLKSVRSSRSQDMIFSGSDSHRPLSMAEVNLILDNSDSALPSQFSEVMVTRRVFRSGDSEYLINKAPCRLRDIHDMFMDTGLGRSTYSIVSQSEIDSLLSLNPEDRRAIFEEAAGIQKFRHRQREAERKLDATRANLLRLADIIMELDTQRPRLEEQARLAQQHKALTEELASLSRAAMICQAHDLSANCVRLDDQQQRAQQDIESARRQERDLADRLSALSQQLTDREQALEQAHDARACIASEAQEAERIAAVAQERLRALASRRADLAAEAEALLQSAAAIVAELARDREGRRRLRAEAAALSARGMQVASLARPSEDTIAALQALQRQCRTSHLDSVHAISAIRNRLSQAQAMLRSAAAGLERETQRSQSALQEGEQLEARRSDLRRRIDGLSSDIESARAGLALLESQRAAALAQQQEAARREQQLLQDAAALRSRLAAIEELNAKLVSGGPAAALQASREGSLSAGIEMVRDVIRIKPGFERAIEAALESRLEDLVASDAAAVFGILDYLSSSNSGRAVVWPAQPAACGQRAACPAPAVHALDVVECDQRHRPVIEHLLGAIIIAPDRESAASVRASLPETAVIATAQGEVFYPGGAVAGGSPAAPRLSLLSEMEQVRADLVAREQEAQHAASAAAQAAHSAESAARQIAAETARIAEIDSAIAAARVSVTNIEEAAARARETAASLDDECRRLQDERIEAEQSCAALEAELQQADSRLAALEQASGLIEQSASCAGRARDTAQRLASALALALARVQGDLVSSARASGQRRRARTQALAASFAKQDASSSAAQEEDALAAARDRSIAESEAASSRLEQARGEIARLQSERQSLSADSAAVQQSIEDARTQLEERNASLSRLQVRRAGIEAELKFVAEALQNDHAFSLAEALAIERPRISRAAAQETCAGLRAQLETLGPVNAAAAADLAALDQRLADFNLQKQDMEKAQEDLLQIIVEIKKNAQHKFLDTFEKTRVEFQVVFVRLFGGGETELTLTDPENPLDAGVEVHVTIPGKRRQNLLLLSGGERAMTALALLLALIKVHPSPFVVLDEVDAPLDDANVGRYTEMLREWARSTQFILITHNRGTMEVADTLHGVTMQKAGISKLVSVRLEDWQPEPAVAG